MAKKKGIALGFKPASEDQFSVDSTSLADSILRFMPDDNSSLNLAKLMAACFKDGYCQGGIDAAEKLQELEAEIEIREEPSQN